MDREIESFINDILNIREMNDYQFSEVCGFTFVFKRKILLMNNQLSSGEIKPLAIIYEENGEYYLAPLDVIDEIEEVIHQFVRKQIR